MWLFVALLASLSAVLFGLTWFVLPPYAARWTAVAVLLTAETAFCVAVLHWLFNIRGFRLPKPEYNWLTGDRRSTDWMAALFAFLFPAMSTGFILQEFPCVYDGWRSTAWPAVPGTIHSLRLEPLYSKKHRELRGYQPIVDYTYRVGGVDYRGARYAAEPELYDHCQPLLDHAASFRAGETRDVFYDPTDPSQAVLLRGRHGNSTFRIEIGAIFFAAGIFLIWMFWARPFKEEPIVRPRHKKRRRRPKKKPSDPPTPGNPGSR